jgi:hypothetical protein
MPKFMRRGMTKNHGSGGMGFLDQAALVAIGCAHNDLAARLLFGSEKMAQHQRSAESGFAVFLHNGQQARAN